MDGRGAGKTWIDEHDADEDGARMHGDGLDSHSAGMTGDRALVGHHGSRDRQGQLRMDRDMWKGTAGMQDESSAWREVSGTRAQHVGAAGGQGLMTVWV